MKKHSGFTILELVITVAIVAVLVAFAAPAVFDMVKNNRLRGQAFELVNAINLARGEAAKYKLPTVLCRVANPTASLPQCNTGTANTWTTGYILFVDADDDAQLDSSETLLRAIEPPSGNQFAIKTNSTCDRNLQINTDGTTNEGGSVAQFTLCDDRGGKRGRRIDVLPVGRPRISVGTSASPITCL